MVLSGFSRRLAIVATFAVAAILSSVRALAVETSWNVLGSDDWHEDANWTGSFGPLVPLWEFNEAARITNGGTAVVSTNRSQLLAGSLNQGVAGVRLGPVGFGTLSIVAGGNLTSGPGTAEAGTVDVGSFGTGGPGTGTLLMNGTQPSPAVLTASALSVSGNVSSLADLSGYSNLTITNNVPGAPGGTGIINFDRFLRITGPNVNVNSTGSVTVNNYTAIITAATHSTIKSPADLTIRTGGGGSNLNLQFSGYTPVLGNTWTLFDVGSIGPTSWDNVTNAGIVPSTGATLPVGSGLRLKTTPGGTNGQQLQVALEANLVLTVNRSTGDMSLRNPLGAAVTQLTGYEVTSARGSLVTTYKGISGAPAGDTGWNKVPTNTANGLAELKSTGNFNVSTAGTNVGLGAGFNRLAYPTAAGLGGLGNTGEDLIFRYTDAAGTTVVGQVEYTGTAFLNNLSLVATPDGQAMLKNDSTIALSVDGYIVTSTTGALSGTAWTSLSDSTDTRFDGWQETPATASALAETNPLGSPILTIAPGESFALGDIGNFTTNAAQAGLGLTFILNGAAAERAGSVLIASSPGLAGDFDTNGRVDGNDFLLWQRNPSVGSLADWKATFGQSSATPAATAVPEPAAAWLGVIAFSFAGAWRRSKTKTSA